MTVIVHSLRRARFYNSLVVSTFNDKYERRFLNAFRWLRRLLFGELLVELSEFNCKKTFANRFTVCYFELDNRKFDITTNIADNTK